MTPQDFEHVSGLLKDRSGLDLRADKTYLLESRLAPLVRQHGFADLSALINELRAKRPEGLIREVTEAMTTNESFFFRDGTPFEIFRNEVLPYLLKERAGQKSLRIWSAAASSGQEPYTLAMILSEEAAKLAGWRIEILGTDIDNSILEKAKVGIYSQFEVQRGLPIQFLMKYFQQSSEMWQIDASIRAMVKYQQLNLLSDFRALGRFDVIFCRNVLIYFDQPTKAQVLGNLCDQLAEDGSLFMGAAETVLGVTERFKPVPGQRGLYARAA